MNSENESTEALIRALRDENHQLRSRCCLAEKAFEENAELRKLVNGDARHYYTIEYDIGHGPNFLGSTHPFWYDTEAQAIEVINLRRLIPSTKWFVVRHSEFTTRKEVGPGK